MPDANVPEADNITSSVVTVDMANESQRMVGASSSCPAGTISGSVTMDLPDDPPRIAENGDATEATPTEDVVEPINPDLGEVHSHSDTSHIASS